VVHEVDASLAQGGGRRVLHEAERYAELDVGQLGADRPRGAREVRDVTGRGPRALVTMQ
jgi:hypothetical protein